ncbi:MFS transporter [Streptacidiphilus fuscans]|uniref:MFS transporter n=1 Tax=Streptacidiphilus fuscans TaxID=2789292 RepID=A0A931B8R3_9ACTN|nr:MFS transporter [Streptacidiphilus fuscans]MBF9073300.1 MFS transporter [Streptacidiphilus fuscans]
MTIEAVEQAQQEQVQEPVREEPVQAQEPVQEQAHETPGAVSLWRHRDFMLLWGGQTISDIGSSVTQLTLPLVAVLVLHATTFQVGLLTAASTLAFLLVALPAGPIVDRAAKHRLMMWCDLGRMVLTASIPIGAATGLLTLGQLYVVALATGVLSVFFAIAYQSYLPVLVGKNELVDANGKLGTTQSFAQLVGPSLGGLLVSLVGAARAIVTDAGSFAISALSLFLIRTPEEKPTPVTGEKRNLRAEIIEGLRFVVGHPILRKVVASTAVSNFFGSITMALQMVFLVRVLHAAPWVIGLVMAGSAVGGLIGGLVANRLGKAIGTARLIWVPALLFGWTGLLIPLAQPGWSTILVAVGFTLLMVIGVLYNTSQVSYRQTICPPALLGRMNASVRWIMWGTMPLGAALGGVLGTYFGVRPVMTVAALGDWAAVLFVVFSPLRKLRDVPEA